ncbi:heavy metal-binding domain-containing protein [Spirosoma panaciterrae]|uniref:heavy metal-binding domain-containing protein n=1 Tax=Spirosoma panaciterrae TaxID=496058 RepID=UPI00036C9618|nr:heavy metal-binding domain-containing protein [Spirosoma panaciterrae]
MLITTTPNIEHKQISKYIGLVNGEAIIGANLVKDFFTSIKDVVGGHSGAYVQALREAKSIAIKEMIDQASRLGANAIIGVDLDYQTIGSNGAMLMVSANGTAVVVE